LLPFFDAVGNLMVLVAKHALPAWRVIYVARPQVPIPQTVLRATHGQLEPFATAEQLLLCPLAFRNVAQDDHAAPDLSGFAAKRSAIGARVYAISPDGRADEHVRVVHVLAAEGPRGRHFTRTEASNPVGPIKLVGVVRSGQCRFQ